MDNLTAKQKASKKYYEQNKDYYNNYYREYRKKHKPKNYAKIYKDRLDKIIDYIDAYKNECEIEYIERIARGEYDEEV